MLAQNRPYRAGMPLDQALDIITADHETRLCPICVDALSKLALTGKLDDQSDDRDTIDLNPIVDIASRVAAETPRPTLPATGDKPSFTLRRL